MRVNSMKTSSSNVHVAGQWIVLSFAIVAMAVCIPLPLTWTSQVLLGALLVGASICIGRLSTGRSATLTLTFVSLFCTLRYFYWRWTTTLRHIHDNGWQVDGWGLFFAFVLLGAETYAVIVLILGFFQTARPLARRPVPLPENTDDWPTVDVFVPTYNEELDIVRPTLLAALSIDWPADRLRVYLLDDGRRPKFRALAEECGAVYISRFDNKHAKAGNINNALTKTSGEYVAIFDCDHIATRSFLQMTMGWFLKDHKLAMVQTPHHFYSPDPFERNLGVFRKVPNEGALFYGVVQQGSDLWNASFFCGSCAVIRRKALEEVGGIAVETVTEDAHTSLRMQRRGWGTAFIGIPQAAGLATGSLAAHIGQRIRWARGMIQILRIECPLLVSGLRLSQRLCYFNSVIHYLYAIPRTIFLTAPLVYLILGKSNLYGYLWEILAYAVPHLILASITNSRVQGKHRFSFWNEIYETVLAPYIALPTTLALINPKWGKFNVTSKSSVVEERFFDFKIARPYLFLITLNLIGIAMAVPRFLANGDPSGVLAVNVFWAAINTLILGTTIAVSIEDRQRRSNVRIAANLPVALSLASGNAYDCLLVDISEGGLALRSNQDLDLRVGIEAEVLVRTAEGEQRFPVEVVESTKNALRLQFNSVDLTQQRALTRVVYSRADSWLNWTEGQNGDRILRSLFQILGIGLKGLFSIPGALLSASRQETKVSKLAQVNQTIAPLILLVISLTALSARAEVGQTVNAPSIQGTRTTSGTQSFHDKQDLLSLGQSEALTIHGVEGQAIVHFAIPASKIVSDAALTLRYRASYKALASGSNLEVAFNGATIGTIPLADAESDSDRVLTLHLPLPADLVVHDNSLTFHLRAQCASPCPDASKNEPWIRIETTSELEVSGLVLPLPNQLSILPAPFFDASFQSMLRLPFAFDVPPDRQVTQAAGILASWYGAMADFRGSHFPVSIGEIPAGNVVLFATSGSSLLSILGVTVSGPVIVLRDNPSDASGKVLVLAGKDSKQLLMAARALVLGQFSHESDEARVGDIRMPAPRTAYDAPRWLQASPSVKIAEDAPADFLKASEGRPARLYFRLAPDLYLGSRTTVPLHLLFKVSGLAKDAQAQMDIEVNGVSVPSREVRVKGSSDTQSQFFAIPTSLLYPSNTITVNLAPLESPGLSSIGDSPVQLLLARTSELDLRGASHYVRLPRMDLFASAGFPFTRFADLRQTALVMPDAPSKSQFALYLDSLGFLGAQTGYPALRFQVLEAAEASRTVDKDLLVLDTGNDQRLFSQWSSFMPVLPAGGRFLLKKSTDSKLEWLSRIPFVKNNDEGKLGDLLNGESYPTFILEQFSLPFSSGLTAVVLAASSRDDEQPVMAMLASASKEGRISGSVVVLNDRRFHSFRAGAAPYYAGEASWQSAFEYWMGFHVWLIPILVVLGSFLIGRRWEAYLERQAVRRLEAGS